MQRGGAPITQALLETKGSESVSSAVWDVRCEKVAVWDAAITACEWLTTCDTTLQAKDGRTTVTLTATSSSLTTFVL